MFGKINLVNFSGVTEMPQEVATAWHNAFEDYVGVGYKPLLYLGDQVVNGINYYFVAEQIFQTSPPFRRIVLLAINADDNGVELIENSIKEIL